MGDKELHEALLKKDPKAQRVFFDRYWEPMVRVCDYMDARRQDSEDVVQDVFIKFLQDPDKYSPDFGSIYSWLAKSVKNAYYDLLRKSKAKKRRNEGILPIDTCINSGEESAVLEEMDSAFLLHAINSIKTNRYRKVLKLYAIQGYKHAEIAEKIGCSENTVKGNYHRAKIELRRKLAETGMRIRA